MDAPVARLGLAVHEQAGDVVELVAEVESNRANGRLIPKAGADVIPQIAEVHRRAVGPYISGVGEDHTAEISADHGAHFLAHGDQTVAAERNPRVADRAHLVASPT